MRRMIPQKLIDKLVARLEREEQTKEMLENIDIVVDESAISGYTINLASDGDTYLTISFNAHIIVEDETTIELNNIPNNFLSKFLTTGGQDHLGTNSLGSSEVVSVTKGLYDIMLTFAEGAPRHVFSTIALSSVIKEL